MATGVLNRLVTADLNGDGLSDILYTSSFSTGVPVIPFIGLGVDLSRGQGAFSTFAYSYADSHYPNQNVTDIVTGDFNGDGKLDVAIPAEFVNGADLALILGTGGGELNKTAQYYEGTIGKAVVLNINADTAPDIAGTTTVGVSRLLNTGRK